MKNGQLNYSELTDSVYWVDGKGKQHDVTQNFMQMMLCWMNKATLPEVGITNVRELTHNKKIQWEIKCKRVAE
jgi:hypothetical protein